MNLINRLFVTTRFLVLRCVLVPCLGAILACSASLAGAQQDDSPGNDPTQPSREITERMQAPPILPTGTTTVQLPQLPKMKIRAIVLREVDAGAAWIDVEGEVFRVDLRRDALATDSQLAVPSHQFQPKSLLPRSSSGDAKAEETDIDLVDMRSTFAVDGQWFTVEKFTENMVLLRCRPQGRLVFVR